MNTIERKEKRKMMDENIFIKEKKPISFEEYLEYDENSRGNLGGELPVIVYRLLEYSIKDELAEEQNRLRFSGMREGKRENFLHVRC